MGNNQILGYTSNQTRKPIINTWSDQIRLAPNREVQLNDLQFQIATPVPTIIDPIPIVTERGENGGRNATRRPKTPSPINAAPSIFQKGQSALGCF
jgi:hypothetical protein